MYFGGAVMQVLLDVDAELELDTLWNVEPVQLIMEYPSQPPVVLLRPLVCGRRRSWPVGVCLSTSWVLPPSDSCNSQPGWRRMNVRASMPFPSRVNVVHVANGVAEKTFSTDEGCVLFQTRVLAWMSLRERMQNSKHQSLRSAADESTEAVSGSGPQQFCFVRV